MKTKRTVPYNYLPKQFPPFTNIGGNEITVAIIDRIQAVAERGDFTLGKEVGEFEEAWATATGADHAIGMSNGTDAIAIALDAAGMEVGAEVVTSPVSFIANHSSWWATEVC
jgi:dTDP-4-amino-4,6-dideoxygalactose transaminase